MAYGDRVKESVHQRNVSHLLHFTHVSNINSIVKNGLMSRAEMEARGVLHTTSSPYRLDGENSAISVSISAINYRMFRRKIDDSNRKDWVVLYLCPSVLWTHRCHFFSLNAARSAMIHHRGGPTTIFRFNEIFAEDFAPLIPAMYRGKSYRNETGIPSFLPTSSEAEVQVFNSISPDHIIGAWAEDESLARFVDNELIRLPGLERMVEIEAFRPHFDNGYDLWG